MKTIKKSDIDRETRRFAKEVANELDILRMRANLSRAKLAQRLGVPPSRITKVLNGDANITLRTLVQFALACNVKLDGTAPRPHPSFEERGKLKHNE